MLVIQITEAAQAHFHHLLQQEPLPNLALRLSLDHPGLPTADINVSFCPTCGEKSDDILLSYPQFTLFIDKDSAPYLENAHIDYQTDALGGQLAIKAPHVRGHKPPESASLWEQVTYLLNSEVNPNLANHGGMVQLVDITSEGVVVLQFGGGCHGCGMVDVTLKQGIERSLMEQLPGITAVKDITDHTVGENPYY